MDKVDYWYWNKLLSTEEIVEINIICENYIDSSNFDRPAEGVVKTATVQPVPWKYLQPNLEEVYENWMLINRDIFGYNLYPIMRNYDFWNYNTYDSKNNGEYGYHVDMDHKRVSDIKFTGIVNISDEPYEGGEFITWGNGKDNKISEISRAGDVILLNYGILHKVNPVTKGIRKTLSFWFYGPPFV